MEDQYESVMQSHQLTKERIMQLLFDHRSQLKVYSVSKIGLFGSFGRNEQNAESDIDFLVDFQPGKKTFQNYVRVLEMLEEIFHRKIDLVIIGSIKPALKHNIMESVEYATIS